ncbi:MAG: DUF2341 domain-containing protein [Candidatus Omnitrophica bacterium]|nr:DUF2341 domain-containing protein [Candidatus Omnitrophota bacterium]
MKLSQLFLIFFFLLFTITFNITDTYAASWYNRNWKYRKKITIDNTKVSGTANFTNFPVLINRTDADWADTSNSGKVAQSDGGDILFTSSDGITKLDHEIEKYTNTSGALVVWVEIPTLSYNTDTEIYIYYGNSAGSLDESNATGTWNGNFAAVWHLSEDPSITTDGDCGGGTKEGCDSTSNNYDWDANGTMTSGDSVDAQIGKGIDFDAIDDYLGLGNILDNDGTAAVSFSAWIKTSGQFLAILSKIQSSGDFTGQQMRIDSGGLPRLIIRKDLSPSDQLIITGSTALNDNALHYVVMTYDGTKAVAGSNIYVDGSAETIGSSTDTFTTSSSNTINFNIAAVNDGANNLFSGVIDEARVYSGVLSSDWVQTEFNNQNSPSTFYSVAAQERFRRVLSWRMNDLPWIGFFVDKYFNK